MERRTPCVRGRLHPVQLIYDTVYFEASEGEVPEVMAAGRNALRVITEIAEASHESIGTLRERPLIAKTYARLVWHASNSLANAGCGEEKSMLLLMRFTAALHQLRVTKNEAIRKAGGKPWR